MNKKNIIVGIISLILFSLICSYGLVFAWGTQINREFLLSNNIFIDNQKLNKTTVLFSSKSDLSKQKITADCDFYSKLPQKKWDYYLYELEFFNDSCKSKIFELSSSDKAEKYFFSLNFYSDYSVLENLLDKTNNEIYLIAKKLKETKITLINKEYNSYYKKLQNIRTSQEVNILHYWADRVDEKRGEKYQIPVKWKKISRALNEIPNAGRPYRASYTDGIHHGWDIDWKLWEPVIALDDGIIVRSVSWFENSDFDKIQYWNSLTYEQKLWNLDILRGKQVWLKTMKWDVVFYSHLDNVFENIDEWTVVKKGQPIGTIWVTGVPWKGYDDYHLHFPVHKNPYEGGNKKYDFEDYMKWPWYFKWKSSSYILEKQDEVFESGF